jgi:hypothetical protein
MACQRVGKDPAKYCLRIQIDLKMAVFWAITHRPDDGGSKDL